MDNITDFSKEPHWRELFYSGVETDSKLLKELGTWLREHKNDFVRLYHGTAKEYAVMTEGLLPTSQSRRNSLQSRSGFVSLSVYEGCARRFGEIAYPNREIEVYAVTVCVRSLVPDADQLRNIRQWGEDDRVNLKNSLANSLVFGHGAQIKGRVEPVYLQPMSLIMPAPNDNKAIDESECDNGMGF